MRLKGLVDEDFVQYKLPSMFLISPFCDFKCDRENGNQICQNSSLASAEIINIDVDKLVQRYVNNPISKSIVVGGLEPLTTDWFENDLIPFILALRRVTDDDIVIYTGYYLQEVQELVERLKSFKNVIVKFGRFIPNREQRFDSVLGVTLSSDNQFAIKIT